MVSCPYTAGMSLQHMLAGLLEGARVTNGILPSCTAVAVMSLGGQFPSYIIRKFRRYILSMVFRTSSFVLC